jgi:hypothetical protein
MRRLFRNPRTWAIIATVAGGASTYFAGGLDIVGLIQLVAASVLGGSVNAVAAELKPEA